MKKVVFVILIFRISLFCTIASKDSIKVFYQDKPILHNQTLLISKEVNNLLDANIKIQNLSKTKTVLKIIQKVKLLADSCSLQFCFGGICWTSDTSEYYSMPPEASDSSFKPIFYFGTITPATAEVTYFIIDSAFSDTFSFNIVFKPIVNKIEDFYTKKSHIYYSKNERRIHLKNLNPDFLYIRIFDLSGREIYYSQQKVYYILIPEYQSGKVIIVYLCSKNNALVKKIIL